MREYQQTLRSVTSVLCVAAALALGRQTFAGTDGETWSFDETTTGADIAWTATTNVDPDADLYDFVYEITLVEVGVEWLGIPFGSFDVTGEIPPRLLMNAGSIPGPAPITIIDVSFVFPEPPDPPALGADLAIGLDGGGFGFVNATNIVLGTFEIDLGFPLGVQEVDIVSLRVAGQVTVDAISFLIGDLDGDGSVGAADLAILLGSWGPCAGCPADLSGDNVVGPTDLAILLGNWG